ncbi:MAG: adenosylcobinamide-GDP ribazoletransferase [Gammaproteobacteria bacterium]|jgi:adenosylcobinamide-GDP ribazoletransferase|nr:adenosylcobinamide-GDP ribazoletransferase [Gammaproteobacteria bacterium]MBT7308580.1 adenosylcobinamide-GDP ribazoletransferase [Gammaproteobacteria bacterium]
MQPLIIAFQLLTRLPIPFAVEQSGKNRGYSILFYPLVGATIGGLLMLLALLLEGQPVTLQAALLLTLWVGLTGGLHLDGLADSADAWVGGLGDREKMLAIMKEPTSGPMGVTAIVLVLIVKWSALEALLEEGRLLLLIWSPLLARTLLITLFQTTIYLRKGGMGESLADNIPDRIAWLLQLSVVGVALMAGLHGAVILLYLGGALFYRWLVVRQLGGITGDVAGAMVEKMEVLLLLLMVLIQPRILG